MHRIASIPGEDTSEEITLIEQPQAPVLLLTSARTDVTTLDRVLKSDTSQEWRNKIRALPLEYLNHQAKIDHYLSTTAKFAKIVIVRI